MKAEDGALEACAVSAVPTLGAGTGRGPGAGPCTTQGAPLRPPWLWTLPGPGSARHDVAERHPLGCLLGPMLAVRFLRP